MTAEIINLRQVRRARERAAREAEAAAGRGRSGMTRAERDVTSAAQQRAEAALDGAKRDKPRPDDTHEDVDPGAVS
jgi:hypothetical protein